MTSKPDRKTLPLPLVLAPPNLVDSGQCPVVAWECDFYCLCCFLGGMCDGCTGRRNPDGDPCHCPHSTLEAP